jgi:hypothetical protein
MTTTADLYDLLPAIYRIRDAEQGGELEALLTVLATQADVVDRDIEGLYDDLFIETCRPWVVPYIADLLDVRGLYAVAPGTTSQRAYVANTIGYRRRKGTLAVLEQLAYDVTGWRAKAVEFFQLLATTQYAKHVRLGNVRPNLRDADGLELLDGPFERDAHSGEVRRIPPGRGRYNIPNIGLYLWRLQSYPIERGTARQIGPAVDERYTLNPLGLDEPLFNRPRTEPGFDDTEIEDLAQEIDVPVELRRRALFDELEALRQAEVENATPTAFYFAENQPVLRVFTRATPADAFAEIPADEILVADLSLWQLPPTSKQYTPAGSATSQPKAISVAVDPKLGRITFPSGTNRDAVEVDYAYGFSGDMGGGPYDRSSLVDESFAARVTWQAGVGKDVTLVPQQIFDNLGDAVTAWSSQPPGTAGVIAVLDSRTYEETLAIDVPEGSELLIVAADWPVRDVLGTPTRTIGEWVPQGRQPHLAGDITVTGSAPEASDVPGSLDVEGLLVEGGVTVAAGNLGALRVSDCTLVPSADGLSANSTNTSGKRNAGLTIALERSICGPIALADAIPDLTVSDSIVDGPVAATGATARIQSSTLLDTCAVHTLSASNTIFAGVVTAQRRQVGCVRFCFVPANPGVRVPRRYRCQPDLALKDVPTADQAAIVARLVPSFTSTAYGHPAYGQLARSCPPEIATGAADGSEMGVFSSLKQPQRAANLQTVVDEYLRFGLEAGVFYVT